MPLTARIQFRDVSGQVAWIKVPANQKVIVGSSHTADIQLFDPRNVLYSHCEIGVSNEHCEIRSLAEDAHFSIDGQVLKEIALLEFTEIQIGQNEIQVQFLGLSELDVAEQPSTGLAEERKPGSPFVEPDIQIQANGLRYFEFPESDFELDALIARALLKKIFFVTRNSRADGEEIAEGEQDLLEDFPENLKSENSLTLHGPFAANGISEDSRSGVFRPGIVQSNSLMIVPRDQRVSREEFLKDARLLLAWLLKPSSLDFHLTNGMEFLIENIFAKIEVVVYRHENSDRWKVVTNDISVSQFSDLGREIANMPM